ncbi:MAG: cytochrome c [Acidimicrobiia bacterium]|nr:cytochrome c [Acidimicrobiia bacterium]
MGSRRPRLRWPLVAGLVCFLAIGCGEDSESEYGATGESDPQIATVTAPDLSETALQGREVFTANCSECHGTNAAGSSEGPPLVHIIYEPGHHADVSFHIAVRQGVRQHHWDFGVMDPVEGLSNQDVDLIVCYVRELQYANGVFSDPSGLAACQS